MKNRKLPYGYQMEKGKIVVSSVESQIVNRVFTEYIAGANLYEIAEALTQHHVEYLPGEFVWNKNRIKRMIEDKRYLGDELYPPCVDEEAFWQANHMKSNRRLTSQYTVNAEDKSLIRMVCCAECCEKLYHQTDNTQKYSETWRCKNGGCKMRVRLGVTDVEQKLVKIWNRLIANPEIIKCSTEKNGIMSSLEMQRMNREAERKLESLDCKEDEAQNLMLQCAAKMYDEIKSAQHITERLKADFRKRSLLSAYSSELLDLTVRTVLLGREGRVLVVLKDGNIIEED